MVYFPTIRVDKQDKDAFGNIVTTNPNIEAHLFAPYALSTSNYVPNNWHTLMLTAGTGALSAQNNVISCTTGGTVYGSAMIVSRNTTPYLPSIGLRWYGTLAWPAPPGNMSQIAVGGLFSANWASIGPPQDGFVIGWRGFPNEFGVARIVNGTYTWTSKANFNIDALAGSGASGINLNTAYMNIFCIELAWLGMANVTFKIYNNADSQWYPFHTMTFSNQAFTTPSCLRPYFRCGVYCNNDGFNQTITIQTISQAIQMMGPGISAHSALQFAYIQLPRTVTSLTGESVIGIQNSATFKGTNNGIPVRLTALTLSTDGTKSVQFKLVIGANFTTPGTYNASADPINGFSCVGYDNAPATTPQSGGRLVYAGSIAKVANVAIDLTPFNIYLYPNERIHCIAGSSANNDVQASLAWEEYQ